MRSPFGRAGVKGIYRDMRADDIASLTLRGLLSRNPQIPLAEVDDVAIAATTQEGDQGLTLGRTVALAAGLPQSVPGFAIDRMCAGGMTSMTTLGSGIGWGQIDIAIAGGVEHMGHHPMQFAEKANPAMIAAGLLTEESLAMGFTAEILHDNFPAITKDRTDAYAEQSQRRATAAYDAGLIQSDLVTIETTNGFADRDEQLRPTTTLDSLATLSTPFRENGRVTAGNASPLTDGSTMSILAGTNAVARHGLTPKMRLVSYAFAGVSPDEMGLGPIPATEKALAKAGLSISDIGAIEINEAFAVQVLAFADHFAIDQTSERLNPWGGAIAVGHPLASSGVRLAIQLAGQFAENHSIRYGITTMCVGLGQGGTMIWENPNFRT
ncbi:MAG: acetyl-CoA C-acyltransferase [Actinobacteria bacterium]|nr:acetyl-CoA C-acyltransferase [Actinomycetota bacterium]MTA37521.1 acetyl-CoA C-acyltransferase [Actinomycetota bacterium]